MPCWYFEKDELLHSPSEADGINAETESRYREEGAGFIIELANKLGIQYDTYAAAVVYFHRFHVLQSFRNFHRHVTATSCLLLSSKTQENKTTLQDLLKTIKLLLSEKQFSVFGADPQQDVIQTEMSLLETLKFDLEVIHPYAYLLHYTKLLKGEKERIQQVLHTSWTFVNDSLYTTLCVQYEPDLLAVAFLYLGCRLTKFDVTDWLGKPDDYNGKWYGHFVSDMNVDILKDICGQVLSLYSKGGQKDETPLVSQRRISSSRGREARSPSPVVHRTSRRRSVSPAGQRRSGRRSLSPLPRRPADSSSVGRSRLYDIERSPLPPPPASRARRSSRSRSRSHHRRRRSSSSSSSSSYSRRRRSADRRGRRDRSLHRSPSPPSPVQPPPEPGTFFLSRESFEEIQAQLRAKSGQPPPPDPFGLAQPPPPLPPPPRLAPFQDPLRPFVPSSYPQVGYPAPPPPRAQVVVAFPYQPPPAAMPPAVPHQPFPPGTGFPQRLVGPTQILVHHHPHHQQQPPGMARPVMTMHPTHIPGSPLHPHPDMHVYGRPPGSFHEVRGPFPQQGFDGHPPPPGVPGYMRPPPNQEVHVFASPEGLPPHMYPPPPHVPDSPHPHEVPYGMGGEGSAMMETTSPNATRWSQMTVNAPPRTTMGRRSNLISLSTSDPFTVFGEKKSTLWHRAISSSSSSVVIKIKIDDHHEVDQEVITDDDAATAAGREGEGGGAPN